MEPDPDDNLTRVQLVKDLIQQAVDKGATSVEQIHQYIAALPFETLEQLGMLDDQRIKLKERQRRTIGVVYEAIRRINRMVGDLISDQIENIEDGRYVARVLEERRSKEPKEPNKETKEKP